MIKEKEYIIGVFGTNVGIDLYCSSNPNFIKTKNEFLKRVHLPMKFFRLTDKSDSLTSVCLISHEIKPSYNVCISYYKFSRDYVNRRGYFASFIIIKDFRKKYSWTSLTKILKQISDDFHQSKMNDENRIINSDSDFDLSRYNLKETKALCTVTTLLEKLLSYNTKTQTIISERLPDLTKEFCKGKSKIKYKSNKLFIPSRLSLVNTNLLSYSGFILADKTDLLSFSKVENIKIEEKEIKPKITSGLLNQNAKNARITKKPTSIPDFFEHHGQHLNEGLIENKSVQKGKNSLNKDDTKFEKLVEEFKSTSSFNFPARSSSIRNTVIKAWRRVIRIFKLVISALILIGIIYLLFKYFGPVNNSMQPNISNRQLNTINRGNEIIEFLEDVDNYTNNGVYDKEHSDKFKIQIDKYDQEGLSKSYLGKRLEKIEKIENEFFLFQRELEDIRHFVETCEICTHSKINSYIEKINNNAPFYSHQLKSMDSLLGVLIELKNNHYLNGKDKSIYYPNGFNKAEYFKASLKCNGSPPEYDFLKKTGYDLKIKKIKAKTPIKNVAEEFEDGNNKAEDLYFRIFRFNPCDTDENTKAVSGKKGEFKSLIIFLKK